MLGNAFPEILIVFVLAPAVANDTVAEYVPTAVGAKAIATAPLAAPSVVAMLLTLVENAASPSRLTVTSPVRFTPSTYIVFSAVAPAGVSNSPIATYVITAPLGVVTLILFDLSEAAPFPVAITS